MQKKMYPCSLKGHILPQHPFTDLFPPSPFFSSFTWHTHSSSTSTVQPTSLCVKPFHFKSIFSLFPSKLGLFPWSPIFPLFIFALYLLNLWTDFPLCFISSPCHLPLPLPRSSSVCILALVLEMTFIMINQTVILHSLLQNTFTARFPSLFLLSHHH